MDEMSSENEGVEFLGQLKKKERRVLGVLIEKSLTTPEYYPLTMKALMTGCNQKSNRSPLSNYDEFEIEEIIDGLRSRGVVAAVQTAGGRTERYRHLLRDKVGWGNAQLAIMGELLLRGRQQLGELRSRASRMSPIESLDELREELQRLAAQNYVQSNGDLQRRGIEIDHALYLDKENKTLDYELGTDAGNETREPASSSSREISPQVASPAAPVVDETWRDEIASLREMVQKLEDRVADLERQLGV